LSETYGGLHNCPHHDGCSPRWGKDSYFYFLPSLSDFYYYSENSHLVSLDYLKEIVEIFFGEEICSSTGGFFGEVETLNVKAIGYHVCTENDVDFSSFLKVSQKVRESLA
jgi:hypothetical protein